VPSWEGRALRSPQIRVTSAFSPRKPESLHAAPRVVRTQSVPAASPAVRLLPYHLASAMAAAPRGAKRRAGKRGPGAPVALFHPPRPSRWRVLATMWLLCPRFARAALWGHRDRTRKMRALSACEPSRIVAGWVQVDFRTAAYAARGWRPAQGIAPAECRNGIFSAATGENAAADSA
jgi:hypothetical protein